MGKQNILEVSYNERRGRTIAIRHGSRPAQFSRNDFGSSFLRNDKLRLCWFSHPIAGSAV